MAEWATFAGLTGVVLVSLLVLSHLTTTALSEPPPSDSSDETGPTTSHGGRFESDPGSPSDVDDALERSRTDGTAVAGRESGGEIDLDTDGDTDADVDAVSDAGAGAGTGAADPRAPAGESPPLETGDATPPGSPDRLAADSLSPGVLLANVALSQGLFGSLLVAAAVYTEIPADALGVAFERGWVVSGLAAGIGLGVAIAAANELGSVGARRFGIDHDEELRELLAPDSRAGWVVLLVAVLPLIAAFEELLFRAALIGALSAGFGLSPWLLAVLSSVAFALGHGAQGRLGVAVTGLLGFVLAAAFVLTGNLLAVIVAHYLVNAVEFVAHEGPDGASAATTGS